MEYLGLLSEASRIYSAVDQVLLEGTTLTPDLGGKSTTKQVVENILKKL
jgi:homoisocitrate dehydrogenase